MGLAAPVIDESVDATPKPIDPLFRRASLVLALLLPLSIGNNVWASADAAAGVSPAAGLARLREGNARYCAGTASRPHQDSLRRAEVAAGQQPFAAVLSCSDSRVPPEVVFDQGLGDLFVIRVAGNVAGVDETGSIDYGVEHLGPRLLVVLGHSSCGAVKAAVDGGMLDGSLKELIAAVRPAAERARQANPGITGNPLMAAAVEANVWLSIETLFHRSDAVRTHVAQGQLQVVGAIYDLASGQVRWLGEHPEQKRLLAAAAP